MTSSSQGEAVPHADLPFRRWREVVVHHADLGDEGYTPAKWPSDYVREDLRMMEMRYSARQPMGVAGLPEGGVDRSSAGASVLAARPDRDRRARSGRHLLARYRRGSGVLSFLGQHPRPLSFEVVGVAAQAEGVRPEPVDGVLQAGALGGQLGVELDRSRALPRGLAGVAVQVEQGCAVELPGEL